MIVVEVSTYVNALEYGLEQIGQGRLYFRPRLIAREIHGILGFDAKDAAAISTPANFETRQNLD